MQDLIVISQFTHWTKIKSSTFAADFVIYTSLNDNFGISNSKEVYC